MRPPSGAPSPPVSLARHRGLSAGGWKRASAALAVVVLVLAGGVIWMYAAPRPQSQTTTVTSTIATTGATLPCSYAVQALSSGPGQYYSSVDCRTGETAYGGPGDAGGASGANASAVIQGSIDALRGACGTILLAPQNFLLTRGITTYPCVVIEGSAGSGDFGVNPNSTVLISSDSARPVITVEVDPSHPGLQVFPVLMHFSIYSSRSSGPQQDGIYATDANGVMKDVTISDVKVFQVGGSCFHLASTAKYWIDSVYAEDCKQNGFLMTSGTVRVSNSYIFGNVLLGVNATGGAEASFVNDVFLNNGGGAVVCSSLGSLCRLEADTIQANGGPSHPQILIESVGHNSSAIVTGNQIIDLRSSGYAEYQVALVNSVNAVITDNHFAGAPPPVYVHSGASDSLIIRNNLGYNPVGALETDFLTVGASAVHAIGLGGNGTTLLPDTDYVATGVDLQITCTGGAGVSITVMDSAGNVLTSGATCSPSMQPISLPIGYAIDFGHFTAAPTLKVFGD